MNLRFTPAVLRLRKRFSLAAGSRTSTDAVLVEISHGGVTGFGEAALPPYLPGTIDSVCSFLSSAPLPDRPDQAVLDSYLSELTVAEPGDMPAKAALDMALHDLIGKTGRFRWLDRWDLGPSDLPQSSYTIGLGSPEEIRESLREAEMFSVLKVKLGGGNDRQIIETIRGMTDKTLRVDVNQGWTDRDSAAREIEWLAERSVEFVEQPLDHRRRDDLLWLGERSPLPIVADEGMSTVGDLDETGDLYDGVNVKVIKCGGMRGARSMILAAKGRGLRVMLGCMTETSCAISAAAQLAPMADWLDLDGALLLADDPFTGARIEGGRVILPDGPGNGVAKRMIPAPG